ncbi:leucine-rich repeat domain-containing protein, partial [Aureispira]|nr:leucine-rich repeat domain-containing protein [Aureispira sp.]
IRRLNLYQAFNVMSEMPNLIALDLSFIGRQTLPSNIGKLQNLKVLIWHEEEQINQGYILETLKDLLPDTKVYFGKKGVATPFLRGNSISTITSAGY